MGIKNRIELYKKLEDLRKRPLIIYITSDRQNASGQISSDAVRELLDQFQELGRDFKCLDLLVVSQGGDPTVAWRIVSLIREQVESFSVLVPQAAYSAATLIALGADEIVMHPHGNLGPTDPQIVSARDAPNKIQFGSEDLSAFLRFAREEVGLSDQSNMLDVFNKFCDQVGPVTLGVAARSSQLSITMGEKLLKLHMNGENQQQKARVIAEKLTKDFFHHGYPVNRSEAKQIGLKIAERNPDVESLMWEIWSDIADELKLREPFMEMKVLREDPASQALFAPVPQINIPPNLPDEIRNQVYGTVLQQIAVNNVPPCKFETIHAVMESARCGSRYVIRGLIFGSRTPDMQFRIAKSHVSQGWETIYPITSSNQDVPTTTALGTDIPSSPAAASTPGQVQIQKSARSRSQIGKKAKLKRKNTSKRRTT